MTFYYPFSIFKFVIISILNRRIFIILFNNCSASKWSTELSPELNLNNGSTAIGDREPSASNVCRVSQISTGQIILSESLYFNVISSDLDLVKLQVSCDQGQIWQNISYSPQQEVIAVSNLAVGNFAASKKSGLNKCPFNLV